MLPGTGRFAVPLLSSDSLLLMGSSFEYSTLQADIRGVITNIKNPMSGRIVADEFGSITIDENIKAPADCEIRLRDERTCFSD